MAADGRRRRCTAMRAAITAAGGAVLRVSRARAWSRAGRCCACCPGPTASGTTRRRSRVVAQNKVVTSQYRAVGHPIAAAVTESMVDLVARDLGLDPAEVRRRNLVRPEELPYTSRGGQRLRQRQLSGRARAAPARRRATRRCDGSRRRRAAAGRHMGIGLACFIELTGPGAQFYGIGGAPISGQEGATLRLEPSGAVTALVGVTNQGQGTPLALAQIIADEIGVGVEDDQRCSPGTPRWGRTAAGPGRAGACRSAAAPRCSPPGRWPSGSGARPAVLLEAAAEDIELDAGRAAVRGSDAEPDAEGAGPSGPLPLQRAARARAEPRGHRALHEPRPVDLHQRRASRRGRGGRRHRRDRGAALRGGGRLRATSSTRRWWKGRSRAASPRAWAARSRSGASTTRPASRSRRRLMEYAVPTAEVMPRGRAPPAGERRRPVARRVQGRGRGRHHRRARRHPERGERRAPPAGRHAHRSAPDPGAGVAGDQRGAGSTGSLKRSRFPRRKSADWSECGGHFWAPADEEPARSEAAPRGSPRDRRPGRSPSSPGRRRRVLAQVEQEAVARDLE